MQRAVGDEVMGCNRSNIIDFAGDSQRELRVAAASFANRYGKNIYSDFILEHGRLPDRSEAVIIGRLLGFQVRASDGSMQPRRSNRVVRERKRVREDKHRLWDQIARLRAALSYLAKNEDDPTLVIGEIISTDRLEIDANLEKSLAWLNRFAHAWIGHDRHVTEEVTHIASRNLFRSEARRIRASNDP